MITKFNNYINESVRDKMIGKSKEDILKSFDSSDDLRYAFRISMENNELWAVEELIKRGILKNYDNNVPFLRWVAYNDYTDITKLAIDNGLKLSRDDNYILNNLIIMDDKVDLLKLFIDEGLILPQNIISSAIGSGSDKIVKYLLELGVEVKQEDLGRAIQNGDYGMVELLISLVELEPYMLRLAISLGRPRIVEILLKAGLRYDDAIMDASRNKNKKIIRLLNQYK